MTEKLTLTAIPQADHVDLAIGYADGTILTVAMRPRHALALADLLNKAARSTALKMQMA
jgi:hypothetical protein